MYGSHRNLVFSCVLLGLVGCTAPSAGGRPGAAPDRVGGGGKEDSGWLSTESYELGARIRGVAEIGVDRFGFEDIAESPGTQLDLVDQQIRYAKNEAEARGYRLNLVADEVEVLGTEVDGATFRMRYEAVVDLIAELPEDGPPTLAELEVTSFAADVPLTPVGVRSRAGESCAQGDGSHSISEHNYAYYWAPGPECAIERTELTVQIEEIFDRADAYPEYDRLSHPVADGVGFRAALVPATADRSPLEWFDSLRRMLERDLGLEGEPSEDGSYVRFTLRQADAAIQIDLFDPTVTRFDSQFRAALGEYSLLYYLGHSNYGNQNLLNDPAAYSDDYQIVVMHSCQSYAYYVQQVFRAKENGSDPHGWNAADVVATGPSTPALGAPASLRELFTGLLTGVDALAAGETESAPRWIEILESMNDVDGWSEFGAAGVRENHWRP